MDTLFQQKMKEYRQMNIFLEMSESEILSDAQEGMKEFSILLKTIEFELIGLQAKIDSINNYKTGGIITDASTLLKLEQILVTTEVERAGLLAKKKAVQSAVVLPQEMINLNSQIKKLSKRTFFRGVSLSDNMQDIEEYEELLANPRSNMKPSKVIGNKVVIYPFRAK